MLPNEKNKRKLTPIKEFHAVTKLFLKKQTNKQEKHYQNHNASKTFEYFLNRKKKSANSITQFQLIQSHLSEHFLITLCEKKGEICRHRRTLAYINTHNGAFSNVVY